MRVLADQMTDLSEGREIKEELAIPGYLNYASKQIFLMTKTAMNKRMFVDKDDKPDDRRLQEALGRSAALWKKIRLHIEDKCGRTDEEWKHYGPSSGWNLKVLLKKRNLFFLMPHKGYFRIAFVFGEKAVEAIEKCDLPDSIKKDLADARKYAEGRGIRLDVKRPQDADNVIKLVDIKVEF